MASGFARVGRVVQVCLRVLALRQPASRAWLAAGRQN
jgi:hypothetical protein